MAREQQRNGGLPPALVCWLMLLRQSGQALTGDTENSALLPAESLVVPGLGILDRLQMGQDMGAG